MVLVAIVTTPNTEGAPDSVPRRVFETLPDLELEVERFVPIGDGAVPYVWVMGPGRGAFEATVGGYPEVSTVERLEETEDRDLYRLDWAVDSPMSHCVGRAGARLVEAHGTAARWELTLWFESGGDASALLECCADADVPISVETLNSVAEHADGGGSTVTERQQEALTVAHELGYFEQPRAITQRELAEQLGISAPALGIRLRRGTENLVSRHLIQ